MQAIFFNLFLSVLEMKELEGEKNYNTGGKTPFVSSSKTKNTNNLMLK
jgi:hypothetical protein